GREKVNMQELYGQSRGALVLLHGGAGSWDTKNPGSLRAATSSLTEIARRAAQLLRQGSSGLDAVSQCLRAMESDEQFNAGLGSTLQVDGIPRLSAAVMDGERQSFSGVMAVTYNNHPSVIARHLQAC